MNVEQARAKLNSVTKSTATKHPKVLISELCSIVKFLLDEIERIKSPPMISLKRSPYDLGDRLPPADIPMPRKPDDERGYQPIRRKLPPTSDFPMPPSS